MTRPTNKSPKLGTKLEAIYYLCEHCGKPNSVHFDDETNKSISDVVEEFFKGTGSFTMGCGKCLGKPERACVATERRLTATLTSLVQQSKEEERERTWREGWQVWVVVSKDNPDFRISPFFENKKEAVARARTISGTKVIEARGLPKHYLSSLSKTPI